MKLDGEKIYLRPVVSEDATADYVGWLNDPEVNQYLESRFTKHTKKSVCKYIEGINADPSNHFFAIVEKEFGKHIGNIKLGPVNAVHSIGDVGLMIGDKNIWGKGYGTEAIKLITDYGLNTLGLHKVTAGAYASNPGSIRAFLKVGFIEEGRKKAHFRSGDGWTDHVLLAKFNNSK